MNNLQSRSSNKKISAKTAHNRERRRRRRRGRAQTKPRKNQNQTQPLITCKLVNRTQIKDDFVITNQQSANCRFYGSMIGCKYGDKCTYNHCNPNSVPFCAIV